MGHRDRGHRGTSVFGLFLLGLLGCAAAACDGAGGGVSPADTADVAPVSETVSEIVAEIVSETVSEISPVTDTPAALAAAVDPDLWWEDLQFIAQPREPGSPHWQAVQDLCAARFEDLGFAVTRHDYGTGVNVIGVKEGLGTPDEWVVVSAHYDHVAGCPGADDNGSAVAGLLEIARVLAPASFDRTLVFACWDEEELGLMGSGAWAGEQAQAGRDIVASLVLEMIGYTCGEPGCQKMPMGFDLFFPEQAAEFLGGDQAGDFIVFIADWTSGEAATALVEQSDAIGLPNLRFDMTAEQMGSPLLVDLFRSDHASFWYSGFPAIMITDSSSFRNPNYHCPDPEHMDTADTLDGVFAAEVSRATAYTAADMAGVR